ncbi:hypothetical protein LZ32DRAFT_370363 [Colletotrichum eremochloae]|nr:hypothetical protein LZ32DRAFT_370363 [Colletotrichum eremochloae]
MTAARRLLYFHVNLERPVSLRLEFPPAWRRVGRLPFESRDSLPREPPGEALGTRDLSWPTTSYKDPISYKCLRQVLFKTIRFNLLEGGFASRSSQDRPLQCVIQDYKRPKKPALMLCIPKTTAARSPRFVREMGRTSTPPVPWQPQPSCETCQITIDHELGSDVEGNGKS